MFFLYARINDFFNYLCTLMRNMVSTYWKSCLSGLFGTLIFLYWWLCYPHALSYQEQYQLFLFTGDYLVERLGVAGGLADYVSEFLVQFYHVSWLGALVLAFIFVCLQQLTWLLMRRQWREMPSGYVPLSMVPPILLLWLMGDESVLLSYPVALLLAMTAALIAALGWKDSRWSWPDLLVVPLLYWLSGPLAWSYVLIRIVQSGKQALWLPLLMLLSQYAASLLLVQWPLKMVLLGLNYYRIPMQYHVLMALIPIVVVALLVLARVWSRRQSSGSKAAVSVVCAVSIGMLLVLASLAYGSYDRDKYEVIRQDYLVRHERWAEIIDRAGQYQVKHPFSCNCVNLALAMERRLADGMFDYYQSGEDALIMPMERDLTSNIPTAEAFWRLGMVNSAYRYMRDLQESILNARKSGRFTKRIVECLIVNGQYQLAAKHLALLKKSLFYRSWAQEIEPLLYHDEQVDRHPVYGPLRQKRFKKDFLYSYAEIDKMLGLLFVDNPENKMALDYFMGEMLLKGNAQGFMQYMSWVQQYGGYQYMPRGYQDAVKCIQSQGRDESSAYGRYVRKMMGGQ